MALPESLDPPGQSARGDVGVWGHVDAEVGRRQFLAAPRSPDPKRRSAVRHHQRRPAARSEEHTSELQSLMRISYAVFCLKKKTHKLTQHTICIYNTTQKATSRRSRVKIHN